MNTETQSLRYLKFELGDAIYAIDLACVSEIFPFVELARPPQLPSFVEGLLNLNSIAIAVLRTDRVLGIAESPPTLSSHLILLKNQLQPVILLVDRVIGISDVLAAEKMAVSPDLSFNRCIEAQLVDIRLSESQKLSYVLNLSQLLLEQEQKALNEFQLLEETRLRRLGQAVA